MKSVMQKDWQAPNVSLQRSKFNRSHGHKTTLDADLLVPLCCDEVLPGDTVNMSMSAFCRLSTPIYPIMDNQLMTVHWFFVPLRLIWDNSENFFGEDLVGGDGNAPVKPLRTTNAVAGASENTLEDYFGIPTLVPGLTYDELPLRGYYEIYNQWYRDQNLQELIPIDKGDLPNDWTGVDPQNPTDPTPILKRNKRHDYFTSSLPWPQKSFNDISIPILDPSRQDEWTTEALETETLYNTGDGSPNGWFIPEGGTPYSGFTNNVTGGSWFVPNHQAWNEMSGTINQLRTSFAIQRYFERSARGGSRYPEVLKAHFGVTSPDARLQRPEYLGRNTATINVTPVASTFEQDAETRTVGDLGAMGTVSMNGQRSFVKSFVEHGYLYAIASVTADLTYQQGLHRMWRRDNRFQYFWPEFAGVGEQAVSTQEIYAGDLGGVTPLDTTFGYQERYAEYRYAPSRISGQFRSYIQTPLDAWHLSQEFTQAPLLNDNFIRSNTPMGRVLAVPSEPHFICDFYFQTTWARPMPLYGIPGNIDRF